VFKINVLNRHGLGRPTLRKTQHW